VAPPPYIPGIVADKKKKKSLGAPPALLRFALPKV